MLNSKSKIFILLSSFFLIGCSQDEGIRNNETVLKVFSPSEAEGLEKICDFFTNVICDTTKETNPADCYSNYMADLKAETPLIGAYPYLFSKIEQDDFFESIDSDLFSEIWRMDDVISGEDNNTWIELGLNNRGKYAEYLELLGEEFVSIKEYHDDLMYGGLLTAAAQAKVLMFPENYDVNDARIRLVIAIHYLTILYQSE